MAELYIHNKVAYEKVMRHFKTHRKAAVIQPCGTGKSHLAGAVASHFKKVLVVAPNDYVLGQATSTTPHADTATYSLLSVREEMPNGYDLIWFDEFHRIGAPTWKDGVEKVIAANPDAKILGTTATPERALEQRNMADEFFKGDVVSEMYLSDAWCNHILKTPTYVIGITEFDSTCRDYVTRINSSKRMSKQIKQQAIAKVNNVARNWNLAGGVVSIFRKYIDSDVRRMIVFAPAVNQVPRIKQCIKRWLNEAGLNHYSTYYVHYGNKENKQNFADFADNDFSGIKVMIAVDMLNEGIHIPDVDCTILLRSTISKNLYLQQIGRCFSMSNSHKPIVLDLADNLSSANGYDDIYNAQIRYTQENANEPDGYREEDAFTITDEIKDIRELMSDIDRTLYGYSNQDQWEKYYPLIKAFYEAQGHLPSYKEDKDLYKYISKYFYPTAQNNHPDRFKILLDMGLVIPKSDRRPYEERMLELTDLLKTTKQEDLPDEYKRFIWNNFNKHEEEFCALGLTKIERSKPRGWRKTLAEYGRVPSTSENDLLRRTLYRVLKSRTNPEDVAYIHSFGITIEDFKKVDTTRYRQRLEAFVAKKHRFPMQDGDSKEDFNCFNWVKRHAKDEAFLNYLIEKFDVLDYRQRQFDDNCKLVVKYGGNPKQTRHNAEEEKAATFLYNCRKNGINEWQRQRLAKYNITL